MVRDFLQGRPAPLIAEKNPCNRRHREQGSVAFSLKIREADPTIDHGKRNDHEKD